jgi:O-antigen/teichoic acid export membrane protein
MINRRYPFLFRGKTSPIDKKRIFKFFIFMAMMAISAAVFVHIDLLMIGALVPEAEYAGYYNAAFSIAIGITALVTILNVFGPIFVQLDGEELKKFFRRAIHYSAILSFPLAFGLIFFAKPAINVLYGQDYLPAALPLYLLSFLIIETATGGFFTAIFTAKEKPKYPTIAIFIITILNIFLNYFLITTFLKISPLHAIFGAAIATLSTRYLYLIIMVVLAKKQLGLTARLSSITKPFLASLLMFAFLFVFDYITKMAWPYSIVEIFFGAAFYFFVMLAIRGIKKQDLRLVKMFLS